MFKRLFNALKFGRRFIIEVARRGYGYFGGAFVNEDSAMKVAAFYRGMIYVSTQLAKLPWEVKDKLNNVLDNDPVHYLLNVSPNNEMSAFNFKVSLIQSAILHGNGYAEIERSRNGMPIAMWLLDSRFVEPYRMPEDNRLVYRVIGGSPLVAGNDAYIEPKDIYHLKNFHSKDGIVGQGVVAYGVEVLGISLGADRMAGNLFSNGGIPSGLLSLKGSLSPEAMKRLEDSWKENPAKTGGVKILEEGMTYTPVNMQPDVLQFLESRQFSVLEIARFLGVPPTKLFDTTAAKYNNMENANLEVANDTFDPWAVNLQSEADIKLLSGRRGGKKTEIDLYQIAKGDMATRGTYYKDMMQVGAITPNQIRRREGQAPYEGGDTFYIATNNYTPSHMVEEVIRAQISKGKEKTVSDKGESKELEQAAVKYLTVKNK